MAEAARASNAQSQEEVCRVAADTLAKNCRDIPFAAFYLFSTDGSEAQLTGSAGFSDSLQWLPKDVSPQQTDWLFAEKMRGGPHAGVAAGFAGHSFAGGVAGASRSRP